LTIMFSDKWADFSRFVAGLNFFSMIYNFLIVVNFRIKIANHYLLFPYGNIFKLKSCIFSKFVIKTFEKKLKN